MTAAEECLWKELFAIVSEMDRVVGTMSRDAAWKERNSADHARFVVLCAKFSGVRCAIAMLQQRERCF
jgi:hypothetical protein